MTRTNTRARPARASTRPAIRASRDRDRPLRAIQRVLERHLHVDVQIRSTLLRRIAIGALGEDLGEQIPERRRVVDAACREVEALEPRALLPSRHLNGMPRVVPRSPGRIDERLVRFEDLPEPLLCSLVARIDVGVESPREAAVRPLDLGLRGSLLYAENDVQIHV